MKIRSEMPEVQKMPQSESADEASKIEFNLTHEQKGKFDNRLKKVGELEGIDQFPDSEWRKIENLPVGYKENFEKIEKSFRDNKLADCLQNGNYIKDMLSEDKMTSTELKATIELALLSWYQDHRSEILQHIFDEDRFFKECYCLHSSLSDWDRRIKSFFDQSFISDYEGLLKERYPALLGRELNELDKRSGKVPFERFKTNVDWIESCIRDGLISKEMTAPFEKWKNENISKLKQGQLEILEMAFTSLATVDFSRDTAEVQADLIHIVLPLRHIINNSDEELRSSAFDLLESRAEEFDLERFFNAAVKAGLKNDAVFIELATKLQHLLPVHSPISEKFQRNLAKFLATDVEKVDAPENAESKKAYAILLNEINESMGILTRVASMSEEEAVHNFNQRKERLHKKFKEIGLEFPKPKLGKTLTEKIDDPFAKAVFEYFVKNGFVYTDGILPMWFEGREVFFSYQNVYPILEKEDLQIDEYFSKWKENFPEIFEKVGIDNKVPIYKLGSGQANLIKPLKAASESFMGQYIHSSIIVMNTSDKSTISNEAGHAFFERVLKLEDGKSFEYDGKLRYALQFNELISDLAELRYGDFDGKIQRFAGQNAAIQYDFSYEFFQKKIKEVNFQQGEYAKMNTKERAELKEKFLSAAEDEVFRKILPIAKK